MMMMMIMMTMVMSYMSRHVASKAPKTKPGSISEHIFGVLRPWAVGGGVLPEGTTKVIAFDDF